MPNNLPLNGTTPRRRGLPIRSLDTTFRPVEPAGYSLVFATALVQAVNVAVHRGLIPSGGPTVVVLFWMCLPAALLLGWAVPALSRQDRTPRLFGAAIGFTVAMLASAHVVAPPATGKWVLGITFAGTAAAELTHRLYRRQSRSSALPASEANGLTMAELETQFPEDTKDMDETNSVRVAV